MKQLLFTLQLLNLQLQTYGYRLAFRRDSKVFPYLNFPETPIIDNGDNHGLIINEIVIPANPIALQLNCINVWLGNGACNRENNKPQCNYDGGDCCKNTCIANCAKKATTLEPCQFKCGTFNGYECIQENSGCAACSWHGTCLSQDKCVLPIGEKRTLADEIYRMLFNCKAVDWSMGNMRTINLYCGTDPLYTVIHDENYKKLHFSGCGLFQDQCTLRPCCTDALKYEFNKDNCDNQEKEYIFYDPIIKTTKTMLISCLDFFFQCFVDNYKYYGQCCQCFDGWTGIDCATPVCWPNCVHGTCIYANLCLCDKGWQGDICNLGKCTSCIYGICSSSDQCDCFYGYTGWACDIPMSYPPCQHGKTVEPNVCVCDEGWQSRICDVPICVPDCGPHGHCVSPNICECDQSWFSSSIDSICDTLDKHTFDPNCITSTNEFCTECDFSYYLDPTTHLCVKCTDVYDAMCFECSHVQCLECQWPYDVDPVTKTCLTHGVFEFINTHLDISENEDVVSVYVRRLYGFNTTIQIDYDMWMEDKSFSRIEYRHDTIIFMDQDRELPIDLKVFKRPYWEDNDNLTTFMLYLKHPYNDTEIGWISNITLRYFDDESLNDAEFTYPVLEGVRPRDQFKQDIQNMPGGKIETSLNLLAGNDFTVSVYSYYNQNQIKNDGKCVFYLIQRDINRNFLRDMSKSYPVVGNHHQLDFHIWDLELKFLHIYSSTQGYSMKYFTNTEFREPARITRIEKHLPQVVSQAEIKQFNHASINITWTAEFGTAAAQEELTFRLQAAEFSEVSLYINGQRKVYTGLIHCHLKYVDAGVRRSYDKLQSTRSFPVEVESCCLQTFEFTHMAARNQSYYFEVNYVQWDMPRNGPCIRLDRQSVSIPLDSVDVEAQAITELTDSPFIIQPVLNVPFLDISLSSFKLVPHYNKNTRKLTGPLQFQTCMPNKYLITHRYEDWQIYELADLILVLTLETPQGMQQALSFFDQAQKKHFVELTYCGPLQTVSVLRLTLQDMTTHVSNSPLQIEMIPGPYDFPSSPFVEDNPQRCYLHLGTCYFRLDLKDKGGNLVSLPNVLKKEDSDIILDGPLGSSELQSIWLQTYQESPTAPYFIHIIITPHYSGNYNLYARFSGSQLSTYPLAFAIYSSTPSSTETHIDTYVQNPVAFVDQICGKTHVFDVVIRDKFGLPTTETAVQIKIWMTLKENQSIVVEALSIAEVSISVYRVTILTTIKGIYLLHVDVQEVSGSSVYLPIAQTPVEVVWESAEPSNLKTTITGSLLAKTTGTQDLTLYVRDSYSNPFNETYWQSSFVANPLYRIELLGDGQPVAVTEVGSQPASGRYDLSLIVLLDYQNLVMTIEIYTFEASSQTWSYQYIPQSPLSFSVSALNEQLYCTTHDLLYVGYGYTSNTVLYIQTSAIAGELFETQIIQKNVFQQTYIQSNDFITDLFLFDLVPESDGVIASNECVCNSASSKYCKFLSGDYDACLKNKQCKWTFKSGQNEGGNLNSCVACDQSKACSEAGQNPNSAPFIQTQDTYFYLKTHVKKIGKYRAQLGIWTQSSVSMLIFGKPDFQEYIQTIQVDNFKNLVFNETISSVFRDNSDWSVAFLGRIKYSGICDTLIYNRPEEPRLKPSGITEVIYTIDTNLEMEVYIDGVLVGWNYIKANGKKSLQKTSFSLDTAVNQLFDFELYLQLNRVDHDYRITDAHHLEVTVETFNTAKRVILPSELFSLSQASNTLVPEIEVLAAPAVAGASNVLITSGKWQASCIDSNLTKRAPFVLTGIQVQIRDAFGNQKLLSAGESLALSIYQGPEHTNDWRQMTKLSQAAVTTALPSLDYIASTQIITAFYSYEVKFELNGVPIAQTCRLSLINAQVDVSASTAQLVQQNRYFGHDTCIFAGELAYLLLDLNDQFGNAIPLADTDAFYDKFMFQFSLGSEFSNRECQQYGAIRAMKQNTYICKIRPALAGVQTLAGFSVDMVTFNGFPVTVAVLPAAHKKLFSADLTVIRAAGSVRVSFTTQDVYGNLITDLGAPCSYFRHERLIYLLGVIDISTRPLPYMVTTTFKNSLMAFDINYTASDQAFLSLHILDGLLLESGIVAKYYTEDNFLISEKSGMKKTHPKYLDTKRQPLYIENITSALIASETDSKYWFKVHKQYDRFAVRLSCALRPQFSELYFFSVASLSSPDRISGFELWIDDTLIIGEGKTTGQREMSSDQFVQMTLHYRVTRADGLVPQLIVQWQSASQLATIINATSGSIVAVDIWEPKHALKAAIFKDVISL